MMANCQPNEVRYHDSHFHGKNKRRNKMQIFSTVKLKDNFMKANIIDWLDHNNSIDLEFIIYNGRFSSMDTSHINFWNMGKFQSV